MSDSTESNFSLPEDFLSSKPEAQVLDCIDALNAALTRADAVLTVISICHSDAEGNLPSAQVLVEALWSVSGNVEQAKKILKIVGEKVRPHLLSKGVC
jgi:hypothetical protein